jgi:hypothetical protein
MLKLCLLMGLISTIAALSHFKHKKPEREA